MALSNKAKNYIRKHHQKKSAGEIAKNLKVDKNEVKDFISEISEPLPLKKKILFYAITLSIPVLFFVLLEASLRLVNYNGDTKLFVDPQIPYQEYYITNPNFAARYFFYTKTIPNPSIDVFLQEKPENVYRIFTMGGSSAAGYPYVFNGTFSRVVDDVLTDAMPEKEVEVVNVATSAISTYTLYDQVDEIMEQKPDAIMIYAGHNEFYGALGVGSNETLGGFPGFVRFYLKLQRFKTFMFLREMIVDSGLWLANTFSDASDLNKPGTLMERIIKDQSIELNGPVYDMALAQFRSNMEVIIREFEKKGIPVYLSTVASNVKDQPPFVSVEAEELPLAVEVYNDAVTTYESGDTLSAREKFEYAKDLDGLKFRAPTDINQIIVELSEQFSNVVLVDAHRQLEQASENNIIGNDLMLEHLHPNKTGYFLIGKAFTERILDDLESKNLITNPVQNMDAYKDKMYISYFDELVVDHKLRVLKQGFPFVKEGSINPYQKNYKPKGFIDSLAFRVVHFDERWDTKKIDAAEYYQRQNQPEKALFEYYGLIRNQPWNDGTYILAARILLNQNNFSEAEPLLRKAYEIKPDVAFTTKMLGAIELNKGNVEKAIQLLEESRQLNPGDPQMLYNLSGAYGTNQEFERAMEIANEVQAINPNFPGIRQWKRQLEQIINSKRN